MQNVLSNIGQVSKIFKVLSKLNNKKIHHPRKNVHKDVNKNDTKEDIQMTNRYVKT